MKQFFTVCSWVYNVFCTCFPRLQTSAKFVSESIQLGRMGCAGSSQTKAEGEKKRSVKAIRKPRSWKHPQPITISQLIQLREEFWDTAPHYGGRKGKRRQRFSFDSTNLYCFLISKNPNFYCVLHRNMGCTESSSRS